MSMTETTPTALGDRIETLDVVRGFALFGILLMNIVGMGFPFGAYFNPAALGPPSQADFTTWFITNTFFEGSMRTLFSMLFGAGFLLFLERQEARGAGIMGAKLYARRAGLLILLGLVNQLVFLWSGDILFTYGIAGMFLLLFWRSKIRGLLISALVLFAALAFFDVTSAMRFSGMEHAYDAAMAARNAHSTLTDEQRAAISNWESSVDFFAPTKAKIDEAISTERHGWAAVAADNYGSLFSTPLGLFTFISLFDSLAAMILGMIAFRLGLLQGKWSLGAVLALTIISFAVGIPVNLRETYLVINSGYTVHGFFTALYTYDLGRVSLAGGWLGVVLLICKAPWLKWLRFTVGSVGRMALSNYLAHSILAAIFFVGLGNFARLTRSELYLVALVFWAFNIVFSLAWLSIFRMGP
ncbi:MAG: DUF418 domain-containing protein, partial [Pseudomonadota bacterium]